MTARAAAADRREHFRIVYPKFVQPRFVIDGVSVPMRVYDCSETGVRYERPPNVPLEVGDEVTGTLRFHPRRQVELLGVVVRAGSADVALRLIPPGIPISVMFAEQRHLMRMYPDGIPQL